MKLSRQLILLSVFCLLCASCKQQAFEPDGAYNGRLAVYGILRSGTDTQYVRLYSSSQTQTPQEVTGATVTLTGGGSTIRMRDTTVTWPDDAGNPAQYRVYVADKLSPEVNAAYQLNAQAPPAPPAGATVTALGGISLFLANSTALDNPQTAQELEVSASFASSRGAYIVRFYLEYTAADQGVQVTRLMEVPEASVPRGNGDSALVYPQLLRVPAMGANAAFASAVVGFSTDLYMAARARILRQYPGAVVTKAIFTLTQMDDALYNYYYVGNGPPDLNTIRLDIPDYTNIRGGLGVFGSLVTARQEFQLR